MSIDSDSLQRLVGSSSVGSALVGSAVVSSSPPATLPVAGIEVIKQFSVCHLEAYKEAYKQTYKNPNKEDKQHPYRIGWGSVYNKTGRPFSQGDRITQTQANSLLHHQLIQDSLPLLQRIPGWHELNEHQQGALLSLAHSLNNDPFVISPRSLLGRAIGERRWYQVPAIIKGYCGYNSPAYIKERRAEEAALFSLEIRTDRYTVINRSRLLELTAPQMRGQDVSRLQKALIQRGYEIEIDGVFGPLTEWAVEKFQAMVGLCVNGVADAETQRVIYARTLYLTKPYLIGSDVREIQSLLSRIGYSVNVTGVFNLRTWQAVVAFQKYFGLVEDGIVAGKTLSKLLYLPATVNMATVNMATMRMTQRG